MFHIATACYAAASHGAHFFIYQESAQLACIIPLTAESADALALLLESSGPDVEPNIPVMLDIDTLATEIVPELAAQKWAVSSISGHCTPGL